MTFLGSVFDNTACLEFRTFLKGYQNQKEGAVREGGQWRYKQGREAHDDERHIACFVGVIVKLKMSLWTDDGRTEGIRALPARARILHLYFIQRYT
jgi:hypothetical protein